MDGCLRGLCGRLDHDPRMETYCLHQHSALFLVVVAGLFTGAVDSTSTNWRRAISNWVKKRSQIGNHRGPLMFHKIKLLEQQIRRTETPSPRTNLSRPPTRRGRCDAAGPTSDGAEAKPKELSRFAEVLFRRVQLLEPNERSQFVIGVTMAQRGATGQARKMLSKIAPDDRPDTHLPMPGSRRICCGNPSRKRM